MRFLRRILIGAVVILTALFVSTTASFAGTTATGQSTLTLNGGTLNIGTVTNQTITGTIGATITGILPSAPWSDNTGTGNGWNGTVAVSDFTYTGTWKQTAGTAQALATTSAGSYTGTNDGVYYTVTVGAGATSTSTPYSYTSNDGGASGSGTATNGTATALGLNGITITFASGTTYAQGDVYTVHAGTQSSSLISLNSAAGSITAQAGTTSPPPSFVNSGVTVAGGGTGLTTYGTAVKFVSAAVNTGMGTYNISPGVSVSIDGSSWAASYVGGVQYTIATGP